MDNVGRDKIEQFGNNSRISIDNRASGSEKSIKKIVIGIIVAVVTFILEEIIRRNLF
jgi:hypothetical protein